nr:hypothetical protein [Tanacetum cinerariifolium]
MERVFIVPMASHGMRVKITASDVREDDEEFEVEASAANTREIDVDPLVIGDSSESSRGGIPDLEDTIYDIVHYMSEIMWEMILTLMHFPSSSTTYNTHQHIYLSQTWLLQRIIQQQKFLSTFTRMTESYLLDLGRLWFMLGETVSKVHDTEDTIKFMLDTEKFTYTMDTFRVTLHLPVETPKNLFVAPVNIQTIEAFMNKVSYQGVVDKVSAFYMKNLAQPWQTMFKVFNRYLTTRTSGHDQTKINILQLFHAVINRTNVDYATLLWIIEEYHSIKDDIPLEIHATDDFKEYETVFVGVDVLMNQPQPVVSTQGTHRRNLIPPVGDDQEKDEVAKATILCLTLHKTALAVEAQENIAKVQEKLDEEETKKMVKGDEDEETYASVFADSMINDDVDDYDTKIEPVSHKDHPEYVTHDDEKIEKEKQDEEFKKEKKDYKIKKEKNVDDVEKMDEVVKEKDIDLQRPLYHEQLLLHPKIRPHLNARNDLFHTRRRFFEEIREVIYHCKKVVPKQTFVKTNEMINKEMPRLVNLAVNKDRKVDPINAQELISKGFATHALKMIEELF